MADDEKRPLSEAFLELEEAVLAGNLMDGKAISRLERMTADIGSLGLFGRNESVDELPTSSLNFLLLPAFLGTLVQDSASDAAGRLSALNTAKTYFRDFLERLRDYGVIAGPEDLLEDGACEPEPSSAKALPPAQPSVAQLNAQRDLKIKRLKESQELERKVKMVRDKLKNGARLDEEDLRSHLLEKLNWWAHRVARDLELIQKLPMLEMMAKRMASGDSNKPPDVPIPEPRKPIILTRDAAQKAVFGAGYPSMYTMTIREYMDMTHHLHTAQGGMPPRPPSPDEDRQDEDLDAARALDEYKDFHRRGWGNTHNKG